MFISTLKALEINWKLNFFKLVVDIACISETYAISSPILFTTGLESLPHLTSARTSIFRVFHGRQRVQLFLQ